LPDPREEALLRGLVELIGQLGNLGDAGWSTAFGPVLFRRSLGRLMAAAGRRGGEFHTPESVVDVIAMMIEPKRDERLCDPCCGTGELLVAAATHDPGQRSVPVDGLTLGSRARRLASMNLAVHGVPAHVNDSALDALRRPQAGDHFHVVVTNPPFNMSNWTAMVEAEDPRWRYGAPSVHNANFAWLQHVASLLVEGGRAAVVMTNNSTFSAKPAERAIRAAMVEDGLVECVVALPSGLFATTGIPVTLWLLRTARSADQGVLFLDASELGQARRAGRVLGSSDVRTIAQTYRRWLCRRTGESFDLMPGFARHADVAEIREVDYDLNPRRYVPRENAFDLAHLTEDARRLGTELANLRHRVAVIDDRIARLTEDFAPWTA
jgi:type I restriction enzyme M protein